MIKETTNLIFDDYRKEESEITGIVSITSKTNNEWLGVFKYVVEKENSGKLNAKFAKMIAFKPEIALDKTFQEEFSFFTREIFPKTFKDGFGLTFGQNMNVKLNGYVSKPKLDENGNPIKDINGNTIYENTPFEA